MVEKRNKRIVLAPTHSPKQQFEVFAAAEGSALSPTLRKCCMDCPGGDLVIVQEPLRERRSSRGDANSDSSSTSKDGSIQVHSSGNNQTQKLYII